MFFKRNFVKFLGVLLIMFIICPLIAQLKSIAKFKGVEIPFSLKYKDSIFEKGKYDFEILVREMISVEDFFILRIKKKRKILCHLEGKRLKYRTDFLPDLLGDPNIPDNSRLEIEKNPKEKILNIIFESGKKATFYPLEKIKFEIEYEE